MYEEIFKVRYKHYSFTDTFTFQWFIVSIIMASFTCKLPVSSIDGVEVNSGILREMADKKIIPSIFSQSYQFCPLPTKDQSRKVMERHCSGILLQGSTRNRQGLLLGLGNSWTTTALFSSQTSFLKVRTNNNSLVQRYMANSLICFPKKKSFSSYNMQNIAVFQKYIHLLHVLYGVST